MDREVKTKTASSVFNDLRTASRQEGPKDVICKNKLREAFNDSRHTKARGRF